MKIFLRRYRANLIRETRFVALVFLWVALYVFIMRHRWTQIEEHKLIRNFMKATETSFEQFESRYFFWESQAKKLAGFVSSQAPSTLEINQDSWSQIYDSHPEWLATHVVTKRQGYDQVIALSLLSRQVRQWFPQDKSSPIAWSEEAQVSAIQLASSKVANQPLPMQLIRSIDKENQWVQILFKSKRSSAGWSTWVVHTFSAKLFPDLLGNSESVDSVLYFPVSKKHIDSRSFSTHKIEISELAGLLEKNRDKNVGFSAQSFAIAKKDFWLSWKYSKTFDISIVRILPENRIPNVAQKETPPLFVDWILSLLWMIMSAVGLWWSYSKNYWRLSIFHVPSANSSKKSFSAGSDPYSKDTHKTLASPLSSIVDTEFEFCRRMLCEVGPVGDISLTGRAQATVEASPSTVYKGSWWIIENIDESRILVAIGDASGQGMAAGTAAYSIKNFVKQIIQRECASRETEHLLSLVYDLCSRARNSLSLGSAHVSLFAAIIDLDQQKLCFINAGFPAPMMILGDKKRLSLSSYFDPIGLGAENVEAPLPRWMNITFRSELVLCNIGARNTDLDTLEDSELVKIFVYPYGAHELSHHPELAQKDKTLMEEDFEAA